MHSDAVTTVASCGVRLSSSAAPTWRPGPARSTLSAGPITFYCGFDPSTPSLQFGNLVQIVTMRRLQDAGHHAICVVGGATGLIGDPSGKSVERVLNDEDVVAQWTERIREQVAHLLVPDATPDALDSIVSSMRGRIVELRADAMKRNAERTIGRLTFVECALVDAERDTQAARGGDASVDAFGPSVGVFRCVKTRMTPAAASASWVSIDRMAPLATVPSTMKP